MKFKRNVIVLIISMFLVSAGYTMVIPFLPLYLSELGVPEEQLTLWTGLVFSSCFFVAALMGPIWGKLADTSGKKKMAVRAGILLGFSYLSAVYVKMNIIFWRQELSRDLPMVLWQLQWRLFLSASSHLK